MTVYALFEVPVGTSTHTVDTSGPAWWCHTCGVTMPSTGPATVQSVRTWHAAALAGTTTAVDPVRRARAILAATEWADQPTNDDDAVQMADMLSDLAAAQERQRSRRA